MIKTLIATALLTATISTAPAPKSQFGSQSGSGESQLSAKNATSLSAIKAHQVVIWNMVKLR